MVNATNTSDLGGQLEQINRQRKLAEMLLGNSLKPLNTTQSSGRYVVPISPFQGIAHALSGGLGAMSLNDLDTKEAGVRKDSNDRLVKALTSASSLGAPQPGSGAPIMPEQQPPPAPAGNALGGGSGVVGGGAGFGATGSQAPGAAGLAPAEPVMPQVEVKGSAPPPPPKIPTLQDYQQQLARISATSGVPINELLANPIVQANIKQLEEIGKPQKLGEGDVFTGPNGQVISKGSPKLTEFQRNLQGYESGEAAGSKFGLDATKAYIAKQSGMKPENIHIDQNTGKAYGVFFENGQPVMKEIPGEAQTRKLPEGMMLDKDGKEIIDPNYLKLRTDIATAGKPSVDQRVTVAQETKEHQVVGEGFGKKFGQIQDAALESRSKLNKLDRMNQLLEGVQTGKLTPAGTELAAFADSLGIKIDKNLGNKQAAEALSNEFALELRNPSGGAGMPGAMSDSDRKYLTSMAPGLSTTPEGRKQMTETYAAIDKRNQEVARMAREYRKKNGSFDEGFYDELETFSNAHPMFGKQEPGWSIKPVP